MEKHDTKPKIFMIMPFGDSFFEAYEMIKTHFQDTYEFSNAAAEDNQQNILSDIFVPIYEADIVLADLTGLNPNVMYELGVAHCFDKKTITITQDELDMLPFDLEQYRTKKYNTYFKSFMELLDYLDKNFAGAIDGSIFYGNPIKDILEKEQINFIKKMDKSHVCLPLDDADKGFLDYLADIEEYTTQMNENIVKLGSQLELFNDGVNTSTREIENVSGSGRASFVRKQAKKIAGLISDFQKELQLHNNLNADLWNKIEVNTLGLLENEYVQIPVNKTGVIQYIKSLYQMKIAVNAAKDNFNFVSESMNSLKSLERTLKQTITFIEDDFRSYKDWTIQVTAGIDRIIAKSKFVVGEIQFDE